MTTTVVFCDTADNDTICAYGAPYTTALDGPATSVGTVTSTVVDLCRWTVNAGAYNFREGFLKFDTSALPDTDVISAVVLGVWPTTIQNDDSDQVQVNFYNWGAAVGVGDFRAAASSPGVADDALFVGATFASLSTGAYNSLAASDAVVRQLLNNNAYLDKTGTTYLYGVDVKGGYDYEATTGFNRVAISSADEAGTTQDPKLTITHSPGALPFNHGWRRNPNILR